MDKTAQVIQHAEQQCLKSGVRLTNKRKMVLTCLLNAGKALSAYEVMDAYKTEFNESMAAMSIYRILDFLETEGFIHKLHLANKYTVCSHIVCNHAHQISQFLICDECGNVKEIDIGKAFIDTLQQSVTAVGYKLKSPQMELHCICESCQ